MKVYVLKSGESLRDVARRKQISLDALMRVNPELANRSQWSAGTKVRLPERSLRVSNDEAEEWGRERGGEHEREEYREQHRMHQESPYYAHQKRWLEEMKRWSECYGGARRQEPEHEPEREHEHEREREHEREHTRSHSVRKPVNKRKKKKRPLSAKRRRSDWSLAPDHDRDRDRDHDRDRDRDRDRDQDRDRTRDCDCDEPKLPWLSV